MTLPQPVVQLIVALAALGSTAALVAIGQLPGSDFLAVLVGVISGHFALQLPRAP